MELKTRPTTRKTSQQDLYLNAAPATDGVRIDG
jgi:hypothetical protein